MSGELTGVKRGGWRGEMEDFEEEEEELAIGIERKWEKVVSFLWKS